MLWFNCDVCLLMYSGVGKGGGGGSRGWSPPMVAARPVLQ